MPCKFYGFITLLMFFSSFTRGNIISLPQPRQVTFISEPVRSTRILLSPQGCFFFISRISPASNLTIFIAASQRRFRGISSQSKLRIVKLRVEAVGSQKLFMIALLYNVTVIHYQNMIRISYR